MNRRFRIVSLRGSYLALLVLLIAACQKSDNFTSAAPKASAADEATVTASHDEVLFYYSAASKTLYVSEQYTDLAKAQLDASVVSNEKWILRFPSYNEATVVMQKGASFHYAGQSAAGDLRVRQNYTCEGRKDSVNECRVIGTKSAHVVISAYKFCIPTQLQVCTDNYIAVGTGIGYDTTNCTGKVIGSTTIYKWVCGF